MATTTNYGWTTPDDTSLVKDGASAIRTLGSSIDTTTKALNPSTTLGDIEYRSATANTNTRLPIGSTGNILTVSGGVPVWAAPAGSGGMTLLSTTTLSGTFTDVSITNNSYVTLYVEIFGITNNTADGYLQIYPNATGGLGNTIIAKRASGSNSLDNTTEIGVPNAVTRTDANNAWLLEIDNFASTTNYKPVKFIGSYNSAGVLMQAAGTWSNNSAITSLRFQSAAGGTWAGGTVKIYGVK
jgi:hypothetical protein